MTNVITNMTSFRGYASGVNLVERTNTANGIESYISDNSVTNPIPTNAPAMANYATVTAGFNISNSLKVIIYSVGSDSTNYANKIYGSNVTYTLNASNSLNSYILNNSNQTWNGLNDVSNYTLATSNSIWQAIISLGLSYLVGNDIVLKTANGTQRFVAAQGGDVNIKYDDAANAINLSASKDITLSQDNGEDFLILHDPANDNGSIIFYNNSFVKRLEMQGISSVVDANSVICFNQYNSAWGAAVVGTVTNITTSSGNVSTGATTVNLFNVPANTMLQNGDTIERSVAVTYSTSSATKRTEVYFGGTQIYDTGSVANTGTGGCVIRCIITRTDSSDVSYSCTGTATGTASATTVKIGTVGGLDFTGLINCYDILTSGVGGSSNDFQVIQDNTKLAPSSLWGGLN